jgi:hypothetical protein
MHSVYVCGYVRHPMRLAIQLTAVDEIIRLHVPPPTTTILMFRQIFGVIGQVLTIYVMMPRKTETAGHR